MQLSESDGFFPTDNLVSNETSYLHVLDQIRGNVGAGEAYIGVGPEQNFSYMVHAKPSLVFIVDVRQDNLLHHLWLKSMFLASANRWEYMSHLFSRPLPADFEPDLKADGRKLTRFFDTLPAADYQGFKKNMDKLWGLLKSKFPNLLQERDRATIERIASSFHRKGIDLTYEIPGRPELDFFPSWGSLMEETDLEGNLGHYLETRAGFLYLKKVAEENRLIPVVGNLAGGKALRSVGEELKRRGLKLGILYISNVEFYLFRNGTMGNFLDNVKTLPVNDTSILIRSYFNQLTGYRESHPYSVPGHLSVSLAQLIKRFVGNSDEEEYGDYWDLVTRDWIRASRTEKISQPEH